MSRIAIAGAVVASAAVVYLAVSDPVGEPYGPTIGDHVVPALHCEEDEALVIMGADGVRCVVVDDLGS